MSEAIAATPVESAAPIESTESIVEAAAAEISEAEHSESSIAPTSSTTGTTTTTTTQPPITQAEKDELAEALGITGDGTAKWTSRVAYSKVHKAVKALREKAEAAHAATLKTHSDEVSTVRQQIEKFDQLVANPDALINALAQVNPAYRAFVKGAPPAQSGVPQKIETMEDLQRVIDAQVAAKLAPITQEREARQHIEAAVPRVRAQIAEAENWPLFKESKTEILGVLKANPTWGLKDAYQQVIIPKLSANRDQVRTEVLAELNTRPHATTVTSTTTGRNIPTTEAMSTEDVVREAMRGIKD